MPDWFWTSINWLLQNLLWEVMLALATAIGLTAAVQKGLGKLPSAKSTFWFGGSVFVVALMFFTAMIWRPIPVPELHPRVNWVAYGGHVSTDIERHPLVTVAMTVSNTGLLPSIADDWTIEAMIDGRKYEGEMQAIPTQFILGISGEPYELVYLNSSLMDRLWGYC
jgi:hypothetical protein